MGRDKTKHHIVILSSGGVNLIKVLIVLTIAFSMLNFMVEIAFAFYDRIAQISVSDNESNDKKE